ncbi:MAG: hypothetical protein M3337_02290 [Actinomycetota bacterium]|nr:hypothetical protein [Actinomycetota bacterium]
MDNTSTHDPLSSHIAARLDREWERLARHRPSIERARRWPVTDGPIDHLDEVLAAAGYGVSPDATAARASTDDNAVVRDLVRLARSDDLAARIVLQRILPGLRHRAHLWSGRGGSTHNYEDTLGELIAVSWTLIRTYDVETRLGFVAANLVRDSAHYAFIAPKRRRSSSEEVTDPADLHDDETPAPTPAPSTELAELLEAAAGAGVAANDLELVRQLVAAKGSTEVVAARWHVTSRTIRNRRLRAIGHLRQFTRSGVAAGHCPAA